MIRMWASLVILWACFVLGILSTRFSVLRLRTLVAGGLAFALTLMVRGLLRGWRPSFPSPAVIALLAGQGLLILMSGLYQAPGARAFGVASMALLTGVGWMVWIETRARPVTGETPAVSNRAALMGFCVCMVVAFALMVGFWRADNAPLVASQDEVMFRIQASALAHGTDLFRVDPEVLGAFRLPWVAYGADSLIPQSASGWPLLLSAGMLLGVGPWVGLTLTLANVALTAVIGRILWGGRAAVLAAAFVAFNPLIVRFGPTYLSHAATLTFLLGATLLLVTALSRPADEGKRLLAEIGAGVLLGLAMVMRPVGASSIGFAVLAWLHLRDGEAHRHLASRTLPRLAIGGLPVLSLFVLADGFSLGWPLRWSHGELFAGAMPSADVGVLSLGVAEALKASWFSFGGLGLFALGGLLVLSGVRPRWRVIAPFLLLPFLAILLIGGAVSTYHGLVPFLGLGFAWSVLELRRRDAALARAACAFTLAGALATSTLLLYSMGRLDRAPMEMHELIASAQDRWGRLLVFVPIGTPAPVTSRLWSYNLDGVRGDVVVALETNPVTNREVLERHVGRQVVILRDTEDGSWTLDPLVWYLAPGHPHAFLPRREGRLASTAGFRTP